MEEKTTKPPSPGSPEAVALGCKCPVLDNARGAGIMGLGQMYLMRADCPLHGLCAEPKEDKPNA